MKILEGKEQEYKDWYNNNLDPYGSATFRYAEKWAELMEECIENSDEKPLKVIIDNASYLSNEADTEGVTGFMHHCAISILSKCWEYGEDFKKWDEGNYMEDLEKEDPDKDEMER